MSTDIQALHEVAQAIGERVHAERKRNEETEEKFMEMIGALEQGIAALRYASTVHFKEQAERLALIGSTPPGAVA
jgi:hypothetical protein